VGYEKLRHVAWFTFSVLRELLGEVVYKDEMEWSEEALSLYWISDRLDDFITVRTGNRDRRPEE
jgi:hypothetical protein